MEMCLLNVIHGMRPPRQESEGESEERWLWVAKSEE